MFRTLTLGLLGALTIASAPLAAQGYSEGYKFLNAVRERDGGAAEAALSGAGARLVNVKDASSGEGALHIVARERDIIWLRFLLTKGARPDLQNKQGDTALTLATQLGWQEGVIALLRFGSKVDTANARGETPLILAVHRKDVGMIRLLMANGANPRKADRAAGYSALDYAKRDDRTGALAKLLESAQEVKAVAGPPR